MLSWLTTSKWTPIVVVLGILLGVFGGFFGSKLVADYYYTFRTPQPITISSMHVIHRDKARILEVELHTPPESFYKACDRLNSHILISLNLNTAFPLDTVIAGGNFSQALRNPFVYIDLPNSIPGGDYVYHIRTIYLCDMFPVGLVSFRTETNAQPIHLENIGQIP